MQELLEVLKSYYRHLGKEKDRAVFIVGNRVNGVEVNPYSIDLAGEEAVINGPKGYNKQPKDRKMKCVITGGRGFVGHHFVEHLLKNTEWEIIIFDKLNYASIPKDKLSDIDIWQKNAHRVSLYSVDLNMPISEGIDKEVGNIDYILHLAAESHVDRSISDPVPFILNNVKATLNILEYARKHPELKMFINFSTDEVYGPAPINLAGMEELGMYSNYYYDIPDYLERYKDGNNNRNKNWIVDKICLNGYPEFFYHHPSNPYSASKSAQEAIGIAYSNTYGVPVVTTHTMNIIGERQNPEKFVPLVIKKVLNGEVVTIHGDKTKTNPGTRFYIHARNVANAVLNIVNAGYTGYDEWNIVGEKELSNLELAQIIADHIGKELKYEIVDFHSSRPGHDLRYALDGTKYREAFGEHPKGLIESLHKVIDWTIDRKDDWL